jgi:hypothetical protein
MTRMTRSRALALALVLATTLPACAELASDDAPAAPGGKADDLAACGEDRVCLDYASYDVMFTNPVCAQRDYPAPLERAGGEGTVAGKPKNVYCSPDDAAASGARPSSPQHRLLEWIDATGAGDTIFLAYLSFSSVPAQQALCEAIERGAEVTFVLDAASTASAALEACGGEVLLRGHQGSIEYAHDKMILINPDGAGPSDGDAAHMKMSFSSGNMGSGAVLHHENWHFIEVARASYFAEAHRCLRAALLDPAHTAGKPAFRSFMNTCRAAIPYPEEDDIKSYFIPVREDSDAAVARLVALVGAAKHIDIGVHRFGLTELVDALEARLGDDGVRVRMIADDDLYWLRPLVGQGAVVGSNGWFEATNVDRLADAGGDYEIRYMETNHGARLPHHNKYVLATERDDGGRDTVMAGAANLTGTGFDTNLENLYFIEIPSVVAAFEAQFGHFWDGGTMPDGEPYPRATAPAEMPATNVTP